MAFFPRNHSWQSETIVLEMFCRYSTSLCSEEGAESQGAHVDLLIEPYSYACLYPQTVGNDQKNKKEMN